MDRPFLTGGHQLAVDVRLAPFQILDENFVVAGDEAQCCPAIPGSFERSWQIESEPIRTGQP